MIAALALIPLAEPAPVCAASGYGRLGGDAVIVRPVGTFEPVPFILLGPTTSILPDAEEIHQTSADGQAGKGTQDQTREACDSPPISNT